MVSIIQSYITLYESSYIMLAVNISMAHVTFTYQGVMIRNINCMQTDWLSAFIIYLTAGSAVWNQSSCIWIQRRLDVAI